MNLEQLEQEIQSLKKQMEYDQSRLTWFESELMQLKQAQNIPESTNLQQPIQTAQTVHTANNWQQPASLQNTSTNQQAQFQTTHTVHTANDWQQPASPQTTSTNQQTQFQTAQTIHAANDWQQLSSPQTAGANQQSAPVSPRPPKRSFFQETIDFEQFLGKYWMGIMASVLVFISIILFAVTVLPYLSDLAKMAVIYAVSMTFISVGYLLYKKTNRLFYMVLTACGMGALYISLLLSNIYFKLLGDIPLYLCILVWVAGIALISKNNIRTFNIIGNSGILISIFLGIFNCIDSEDSVKFLVLTVFFIVTSVIFEVLNYKFFTINTIYHLAGFFLLVLGYEEINAESPVLFSVLLITGIAQLVYMTYRQINPYFLFHIINQLLLFLLFNSFFRISDNFELLLGDYPLGDYIFYFGLYALALLGICLNGRILRKMNLSSKYDNPLFLEIFYIIVLAYAMFQPNFNNCVTILLVPAVLILLDILKKERHYSIAAAVTLAISLFLINGIFSCVLILSCAAALIFIHQKTQGHFSDIIRAVTSVILRLAAIALVYQIFRTMAFRREYRSTVILLLMIVIDMGLKHLLSHKQQDKAIVLTTHISCMLCSVFIGWTLLHESNAIIYYIVLLAGCASYMNNVIDFIRSRENWKHLYAAIKVTVYIVIVLQSLQAASILFSVALFVTAIVWVLVGFKFNSKWIRLYGLVITINSMAKLLLVDIHYSTSLMRAVGFFVCGIFAFFIYFIYNRFEKARKTE